ncbi:hypothetical protein ACA910_008488 [Epithemia clementina (nom. ined.)]
MELALYDIWRYQDIVHASHTARNAWTIPQREASAAAGALVQPTSRQQQQKPVWWLSSSLSEMERAQVLSLLLRGNREFHYGDYPDRLDGTDDESEDAKENNRQQDLNKKKDGHQTVTTNTRRRSRSLSTATATATATTTTNHSSTRIPWRQQVQQRQTVEDWSKMGPMVLLWIPPLLGFIPTLLAIAAPQSFTHHFHNAYERVQFALVEEEHRRHEFHAVVVRQPNWEQHGVSSWLLSSGSSSSSSDTTSFLDRLRPFFSTVPALQHQSTAARNTNNIRTQSSSAAPSIALVPNPVGLYETLFAGESGCDSGSSSAFLSQNGPRQQQQQQQQQPQQQSQSCCRSLDKCSPRYLYHLALAAGVYQSWRIPYIHQALAWITPAAWLRSQIRTIVLSWVEEDAQLLVEGHDQTQCAALTNDEVLDACLLRNLPIVVVVAVAVEVSAQSKNDHGDDEMDNHNNVNNKLKALRQGPESVDYSTMRVNLTHHLQCMAVVYPHVLYNQTSTKQEQLQQQRIDRGGATEEDRQKWHALSEQTKERLGLFALHLSILRDQIIMPRQEQQELVARQVHNKNNNNNSMVIPHSLSDYY